MSNPIITTLSKNDFAVALSNNPGFLVIKFGAEWCGPCKLIETQVHNWMNKMPSTIQCAIIDVDDNFEIYAFLKSKKMINGIPAILCYEKNNLTHIPDDSVIGANPNEIDLFFNRCLHGK